MDKPEVEVGGAEDTLVSESIQNTVNSEAPNVVMHLTQNTKSINERLAERTPDISLPDVGEPELKPSEESPFLAEAVSAFSDSGSRRIELPDENVEAFGYFLQYQYTQDYSISPATSSTEDVVIGEIDDSGDQLLKHARVYTLAEKLGMPSLKTLAHSKIHRINSSPHGEITYARYVYTHTPVDDVTIRKSVASFWAMRSHVLRHEAEEEFCQLCLEVPRFCFDVLSLILDDKEKRSRDKAEAEFNVRGSGRKRLRSVI
ncbi:uncharacterized protein ATNIH1004_001199 [Aspergillus tanneri]|uniref:BTB domain-containing protein n=1 Tax=Aspergillus tanneri TaxID=1220188 RepID=A0A5M9MYW7_9EURO|nr:uncharacterized protein ATNIH1004_001199 [Aspergillus tanneri]KAA8652295.1 hypothetical protein ATNIH1004_001199 [Aspergillus tanneri]